MEKYGLIGYPLRHSFSIGYFNEKFRSEGINAEYVNFEIPNINDFMEVIEENPNLCGLNVTIPYKEQVIPFLNELDRDTAKIGAVNVIKIIRQPERKSKTGRLQFRHHRFYTIYSAAATTSAQKSTDPRHRRCFQSCLSRTQESGYRKRVCIADTQDRRYADLRRTDSGNHGGIHRNRQLYSGRNVPQSRFLPQHSLRTAHSKPFALRFVI